MRARRPSLLVVDVQAAAVAPGLHAAEEVLTNVRLLIARCREVGVEVVFVQHDGAPGTEYEPDTPGWVFHPSAEPLPHERVVRKRHNSAFQGTDLADMLRSRSVDTLIIVGLHTELCVDTTVRSAFEHGFRVVVPALTNTTFGAGGLTARQIYEHHNGRIFTGRFADTPSVTDVTRWLGAGASDWPIPHTEVGASGTLPTRS